MHIARDKKQNNIAEYVIYMWQVQDLIRSCNMDINLLEDRVLSKFQEDEATRIERKLWYENLIEEMQEHGLTEKGNLPELTEIIKELTLLHHTLLTTLQDPPYKDLFVSATPGINELEQRTRGESNPVMVALNGLYGMLLLRLQKKEVSEGTTRAVESFGKMLGYLSAKYKLMKSGQLDLSRPMQN